MILTLYTRYRQEATNAMAPKIKITYFHCSPEIKLRARVEISRLELAAAKKEYDYSSVGFGEWPALKPKIATGALPCLEIDGRQFGQGIAIQTYLAEICGLYGKSPMDHLIIDQISLCREDMLIPETKHFLCGDEAEKASLDKGLVQDHYPKYCDLFTKLIEQGTKDFILGSSISLADIVIFEAFTTLSQNHPEILEKYPKIVALRKKVADNAGIKAYIAKGQSPM